MNNMKKALALVMSLALAASTFVVGAAYDDVPENHDNRIAINLLGDLGVMVGDAGTNDFRPEGTLKRSEAAAIVYRLRTGKTNADSYVGTTGFSDVSDSHWASGYINYCVNQGIIAGYPDGTFKPDQDVTYAEYIKMVVCALNLQKVETTTYIDMNTGVLVSEDKITTAYPTGYIALASDQQINEGIDYLNPNDKISRAEVAQGAYNAIFESYYKLDPKDADYVKDSTEYQHLAKQVFKLDKKTGVVTAFEDYTTNYYNGKSVVNGNSQEANYFEINGEDAFEYADFNPALVGQEVYVWEKERNISSASDKKVVAVVATEDNTVTTINTNDLKKDDGDWYYTNSEGKKQVIKADELTNTQVMLNGKAYDVTKMTKVNTVADLLNAVAECRLPMDLTFIDSDESPKSPTVISIKVYGQTEITSVTEDKLYIKNVKNTYEYNDIDLDKDGIEVYAELFADLYNKDIYDTATGSIDLKNDDDTVNTSVKYYDGIAKEDKVMIYGDVNGVIDVRKIEEKEGTIKAMDGGKFRVDDDEVYVLVGDDMKARMTTNNNSDAVAYIDPFTGYVINVDEGVGNVSDYYYVHMIQRQYATSGDYQFVAYDYEGNKVTLTFRDRAAEKSVMKAMFNDENKPLDSLLNSGAEFGVIDAIGIFDVNSKGQITRWRSNNTGNLIGGDGDVFYDKDAEYNTKTGYVTIAGKRVEIKPSSVVFGVEFKKNDDGTDNKEKIDDVKTYVGSFPKITAQEAPIEYYLKAEDDDLKAGLLHGTTKGGNTEFTNVTGYVLGERFEYTGDDKGYAIYKIATKGEIKEYETEVVDDTDLRDLKDESVKGMMVKFDLTTDGKILYSDEEDIEIVGEAEVAADKSKTFENIAAKAAKDIADDVAAGSDALSDFETYFPGSEAFDEDEIYFGIVVEGRDEKYLQLVDGNGNSIIIDYADDVKAYRITDAVGKWDSATAGTTGNITDSNAQYTTYAAVRVVDGDDVNDARITEVYTKTIEEDTYNELNKQYGDSKGNFNIVAGAKDEVEETVDTQINTVKAGLVEAAKETISVNADGELKNSFSYTIPDGYTVKFADTVTNNASAAADVKVSENGKTITVTAKAPGFGDVEATIVTESGAEAKVKFDVTVVQGPVAVESADDFLGTKTNGISYADLLAMDVDKIDDSNVDDVEAARAAALAKWNGSSYNSVTKDTIAAMAGLENGAAVEAIIADSTGTIAKQVKKVYTAQADKLVADTVSDLQKLFITDAVNDGSSKTCPATLKVAEADYTDFVEVAKYEAKTGVTVEAVEEEKTSLNGSSVEMKLEDGKFQFKTGADETGKAGDYAIMKLTIDATVKTVGDATAKTFFVKVLLNA